MGCWLGEGWSGGRVPLVVKGNQVAGSQTSSDEQSIDNHEDDEDEDEDDEDGDEDGDEDDEDEECFEALVSTDWFSCT